MYIEYQIFFILTDKEFETKLLLIVALENIILL